MKPVTQLLRRLLRLWRSSLTMRVLSISILVSVLIASVVTLVALTTVRDGLVEDRVNWSLRESANGLNSAVRLAGSWAEPTNQGERAALVEAVVAAVAAPAGSSGDFEVLLLTGSDQSLFTAPERGTALISSYSVLPELRTEIETEQKRAWQISQLVYVDGSEQPGVIVGSPIYLPGIGDYQLYQLFPLQREIQTLDLTRSALGLAGVLMGLALVGVSFLLTRGVVRPIRLAAQSASQLRSGRLTERMAVRGQDDLARLALAFNEMAASMQEQIRRLEELSRVQQRFVSDVSHELRTPLTTIRMAAEMLHGSSDAFDPASQKAAELLQQQSVKFEELLAELLEISRYDAGTVKLDPMQIEPAAVVQRIVSTLQELAVNHKTTLELTVSDSVGVIECDPRRFERVVRNLISNAIEHSEGMPVAVSVAGSENAVAVSVRDFGAGLKPGEAALVFNRFWRADPSRQRSIGGTGLGLAISLEDARLHGGWIDAEGEPGGGSNFRLVLPRKVGAEIGGAPLPLALDEIDTWLGQRR